MYNIFKTILTLWYYIVKNIWDITSRKWLSAKKITRKIIKFESSSQVETTTHSNDDKQNFTLTSDGLLQTEYFE